MKSIFDLASDMECELAYQSEALSALHSLSITLDRNGCHLTETTDVQKALCFAYCFRDYWNTLQVIARDLDRTHKVMLAKINTLYQTEQENAKEGGT